MADYTITPANVVFSSKAIKAQNALSGEAINAGEPVLLVSGAWMRADANDPTLMPAIGVAGNSAPGAGQPLQVYTEDPNLAIGAHGAGLAIPMFMSANVGKWCPFGDVGTGNQTQLLAITVDATHVNFKMVGGTVAHA